MFQPDYPEIPPRPPQHADPLDTLFQPEYPRFPAERPQPLDPLSSRLAKLERQNAFLKGAMALAFVAAGIATVVAVTALLIAVVQGRTSKVAGAQGQAEYGSLDAAPVQPRDQIFPGARASLTVVRGLKVNVEYPLYAGMNYIGRADDKPVDIDLDDQEPADRVWSSRQHALVTCENGKLVIEDLNSANGTFVNRNRILPGRKQPLEARDIIQVGTVQMKVKF